MDYEIVWSPEALDDVDDIASYIARDSPAYAGGVVERIVEAARRLASFPSGFRIVPETDLPEFRETFVFDYRVICHVMEHTVTVVAVVHGRRLLKNWAKER